MRVGICGLGRMGEGLALQAIERGHEVRRWVPAPSDRAGSRLPDSGSRSAVRILGDGVGAEGLEPPATCL